MARHVFEDLGIVAMSGNAITRRASKVTARTLRLHLRRRLSPAYDFQGCQSRHRLVLVIDSEWPVIGKAFEAWLAPENFDVHGQQTRRLEDIRAELQGRV